MTTVVVALDRNQGTVWPVPSDCYGTVQIECIGPGGQADSFDYGSTYPCGGSGGAYTKANVTIPAGTKFAYLNWLSNTWINFSSNSTPTTITNGVKAAGGSKGSWTGTGGYVDAAGGQASACVPSTGAFSGGASKQDSSGGAAGPSGVGGAGAGHNGAGGTANGGAAGTAGTVGTSGAKGNIGSASLVYTDFFGNKYGPAGGGGGGSDYNSGKNIILYGGGPAANYGAGGTGSGNNNGLIIITYTSQPSPQGRYVVPIDKTGTTQWRVPDGVTNIKVEALGAGSAPYLYGSTEYIIDYSAKLYYPFASVGGGGGAYALNYLNVVGNSTLYLNIPSASTYINNKTWLNKTNSIPTSLTTGILAAGAGISQTTSIQSPSSNVSNTLLPALLLNSQGGQAQDSIGIVVYSGGNGGNNYSITNNNYITSYKQGNAGGGGSAGPNGPGGNGGNSYYVSTSTGIGTITGANGGSGGGGGANGGGSGSSSTSTSGAAGGTSYLGVVGGTGSTAYTTTPPSAGSNGSGGGGGSYYRPSTKLFTYFYSDPSNIITNTVLYVKGGAGSTQVLPDWNMGNTAYGPGSGSGGAGRTWFGGFSGTIENDTNGPCGPPGKYGGGTGTGLGLVTTSGGELYGGDPSPGQGLVVIQYTVTKNPSAAFLQMFK